jgi:hypothetical protein
MMTESVKARAARRWRPLSRASTSSSPLPPTRRTGWRLRSWQAGRVLRGLEFPVRVKLRVPALAHAQGGAGGRRDAGVDGALGIEQRGRRGEGTMREEVVLERDVDVTAIPYGDRISLQKGHPVIITQALGGSYTLVTMQGYMVRLDGPGRDAIGKEPQAPPTAEEIASKSLGDLVWDQLRTCYDPEIPVNIVELGLVHSADVTGPSRRRQEGGGALHRSPRPGAGWATCCARTSRASSRRWRRQGGRRAGAARSSVGPDEDVRRRPPAAGAHVKLTTRKNTGLRCLLRLGARRPEPASPSPSSASRRASPARPSPR